MRALLLAVLLVHPSGDISAQLLRGHVRQGAAGEPVRLATVQLLDDRDRVVLETLSDSTGAFRLRAWQAGKYRLRTSALGYGEVTSEVIELVTGEEVVLSVPLAPRALEIEPINVISRSRSTLKDIALRGYYDRRDSGRRIGMGRFLDRGEVERMGTRLSDVLRRVPGMRIVYNTCGQPLIASASNPTGLNRLDGQPSASTCGVPPGVCLARFYLDGVAVDYYQTGASLDQIVPLEWVEAVEAYRRPAELPAEFLQSGACGVVAVWTRRG